MGYRAKKFENHCSNTTRHVKKFCGRLFKKEQWIFHTVFIQL